MAEQAVSQYQVQGLTGRGWVTTLLTPEKTVADQEQRRLLRYGVHPSAVRIVTLYVPDDYPPKEDIWQSMNG